jgi:hypothetical protein
VFLEPDENEVGSVADAQRAAAGVDVIVAQGVEAGGGGSR